MKLATARKDFLEAKKLQGVSQGTLDLYGQITGQMTSIMNGKPVVEVKTSEIRTYLNSMDCADTTRANHIRTLKVWFNWLQDEGVLEDNPMSRIPNPKVKSKFGFILNNEELGQMLYTCKGQPRNHAIICLLLDTGMRVSELCDLQMDDVSIDRHLVHIRNGKGGKGRTVYFSDATADAINNYLQTRKNPADDSLFISWKTHGRMDRNAVCKMVKRLGKRAGINGDRRVSPHTLRRCFATEYIKNGGDSHSLARLLGHSTTRVAEKYVNLVSRDVQEIYNRCSPVGSLCENGNTAD